MNTVARWLLPFLLGYCLVVLFHSIGWAHWKPEYAQLSPKMQQWFQGLRAPDSMIPCCDLADGKSPDEDDVEYDTKGDHYRVRIKGKWYDVPDGAVIKQPNMYGRTVVWYYFQGSGVLNEEPTVIIRCFMPGGGV